MVRGLVSARVRCPLRGPRDELLTGELGGAGDEDGLGGAHDALDRGIRLVRHLLQVLACALDELARLEHAVPPIRGITAALLGRELPVGQANACFWEELWKQ